MALTTQTSDAFRLFPYTMPDGSIGTWYGLRLPAGVTAVTEGLDPIWGERVVKWKTRAGEIRDMPFEPYPDSIHAVITAMKLTC